MAADDFGEFLRQFRRKIAKLTQQELADQIGIDRTYVSRMENGEQTPATETLMKIARGLDIKLSDLVDLIEIENASDYIEPLIKRYQSGGNKANQNTQTSLDEKDDGEEWVQRYVSDTGARVYFSKDYLRKLSPKTWRQIAAIIKEEFSEDDDKGEENVAGRNDRGK